ncbi:MAG: hypothetical protein HY335_05510 [Deinococcus sp.]|nr:hypothetical protein [Deinococcus sp.]
MAKSAVIFGAGKIARGFIAHLLTLSGYQITFVEKVPSLVALLRQRGQYQVQVMGAPEKNIVITDFQVLASDQVAAVAEKVAAATVVYVSIGGPNLPQIAPLLTAGVRRAISSGRTVPLNVVLCENYYQPAQWLRQLVTQQLTPSEAQWFSQNVGIVETMVLRSSVEPTEEMKAADPLSLRVQDMWEMPAEKEAFVGEIPAILGLVPQENFQGGLTRKLFTYNAINAIFAYMGYLKGYQLLSEAANDPELVALARAASNESGQALCRRFGFDPQEQRQFAESAISKYQKREIVDPIERNARDPIRKLGRNDRLVGPACLAREYGIRPAAHSRGIAAALHYNYPEDPAAQKLQAMIQDIGLVNTIRRICGLAPGDELITMISDAYQELGASKRSSRLP